VWYLEFSLWLFTSKVLLKNALAPVQVWVANFDAQCITVHVQFALILKEFITFKIWKKVNK